MSKDGTKAPAVASAKGRAAGAAPAASSSRRATLVVWALIAAYAAVFITISLVKYANFLYNDFDMAIFAQAAHTTLRGSLYSSILGVNYLANHMSLLMFPLSVIYVVLPSPVTLLVVQTVVLALGALPVFWLARREIRSDFVAVCFAALYLLYPALGYSNLYEFHPETMAASMLLFAFYYLWVGRFWRMTLFAVLAMSCKEDVALVVAAMGLYALLVDRVMRPAADDGLRAPARRWAFAATLVGLAALFLVASVGFIMPALNHGEIGLQNIYADWGPTPGAAALHMARSPARTLESFFMTPGQALDTTLKQQYYVHMLLPVLFLALLSPLTLAIALPAVAQHMLSARPSDHTIVYHYTACVTPFVLASSVLGLRNLLRLMARGTPGGVTEAMRSKSPVRALGTLLAGASVVVAVGCNFLFGPVVGSQVYQSMGPPQSNRPTAYDQTMAVYMSRMARRVSVDGGVACTFKFLPRAINRPAVYSMHMIFKGTYHLSGKPYPPPDDVAAVAMDASDPLYLGFTFARPEGSTRLRQFLEANRLAAVESAGDVVLFLREPAQSIRLCETGDFTPDNRRALAFGGRLMFLGWDRLRATAAPGGRLPVVTCWKRTALVDRLYFTQFVLLDEYGRDAYEEGTRILCRPIGYTFYPAHDWPAGAVVRERYNLVIPANVTPGRRLLAMRVLERLGPELRLAACDDPELRRETGLIRLGTVDIVPAADGKP
jgi:uncharacterized membrane protein